MIWASTQVCRSGRLRRIQSNSGRSSSYTPNLRTARGSPSACRPAGTGACSIGQGYLVAASSTPRVRLSPRLRPSGVERLGLQPGQQPERLRVALEAADVSGQLGQRALAVVPERRVAEVVREAGRLDQVGVAADGHRHVAADLGDLEGVGEPVAGEVVGRRADHLGLGGRAGAARRSARSGPGRARTAYAGSRSAPPGPARRRPGRTPPVEVSTAATLLDRRDWPGLVPDWPSLVPPLARSGPPSWSRDWPRSLASYGDGQSGDGHARAGDSARDS